MYSFKSLLGAVIFGAALALWVMPAQAQLDQDFDGQPDALSSITPGNPAVAAAARLRDAVLRIDPSAELAQSGATFTVNGMSLMLVYDLNADRMRIMTPIAEAQDIEAELLLRMMQANFDSALDARYAVANGVVWGTFIHRLSSLNNSDFASGIGQTVNVALTYGSSFASGGVIFGGGDSTSEHQKLIEELQKKSEEV